MAGRQWVLSGTVAGVMAVMLWACGGDSSPTGPSDGGGGGGGGTRVETDTITITSTGVSPRDIIVNSGTTVKFVNNDTGSHEVVEPAPCTHRLPCAERWHRLGGSDGDVRTDAFRPHLRLPRSPQSHNRVIAGQRAGAMTMQARLQSGPRPPTT
jgi:plastocyanin